MVISHFKYIPDLEFFILIIIYFTVFFLMYTFESHVWRIWLQLKVINKFIVFVLFEICNILFIWKD